MVGRSYVGSLFFRLSGFVMYTVMVLIGLLCLQTMLILHVWY